MSSAQDLSIQNIAAPREAWRKVIILPVVVVIVVIGSVFACHVTVIDYGLLTETRCLIFKIHEKYEVEYRFLIFLIL